MLFHEIYSTYFQTVAKILAEAVEHPLTTEEINAIIQDYQYKIRMPMLGNKRRVLCMK